MILFIHIAIALSSLAVAILTFTRPSNHKLRLSHGFAAGTFASGLVLALSGASLVHACISGTVFLGGVLTLNELTRRKLLAIAETN